jgi:hypothetical protein
VNGYHFFYILNLAIRLSSCTIEEVVSNNAPQDFGGEQLRENADRRQYPRIVLLERLWCESQVETILVQTANISRGGLFLHGSYQPELGARLSLSHLDLVDDLTNIDTEVVWNRSRTLTDRGGIGLRFVCWDAGLKLYEYYRNRRRRRESVPPVFSEWTPTNIYSK